MSAKKKTTEFLKECMADAVLSLMKKKALDKITVADIVEEAGVGRTTWFRNFKSKEDAITYKLVCLWERWSEEHGVRNKTKFTVENYKTFFEFNYEIRDILDTICNSDNLPALFNAFLTVMASGETDDMREHYEQYFYAYASFGLLVEWIGREYRESPEEMATLLPVFGKLDL